MPNILPVFSLKARLPSRSLQAPPRPSSVGSGGVPNQSVFQSGEALTGVGAGHRQGVLGWAG